MSDDMTKRERQKARRAVKTQAQLAEAKAGQRRRLLTFVVLGLVVVGGIGFLVQGALAEREAREEEERVALEQAEAAGCTEDVTLPNAGAGHFASQEELVTSPPEVAYTDRPAASGKHFANWASTGVYDVQIDERIVVHNLEHGYVALYYTPEAPPEQVEQMKTDAQALIDDGVREIVLTPYGGPFPDGKHFGFVSWNHRQTCDTYVTAIMNTFAKKNQNSTDSPERAAGPHIGPEGGIVPEDGQPYLLAPLGTAASPDDGASESPSEGASDAPSGASSDAPIESPSP